MSCESHPRSMGPKMDSIYAILGCLLRSRFVSPLWVRQTDTQRRGSPLINYASSPSFSLFQRPSSLLSWRNENSGLRSWKLKPNPTSYSNRSPVSGTVSTPQLHLASAMVARALDEHCGAVNHALLLTGNSRLCRLQFKWKWLAT